MALYSSAEYIIKENTLIVKFPMPRVCEYNCIDKKMITSILYKRIVPLIENNKICNVIIIGDPLLEDLTRNTLDIIIYTIYGLSGKFNNGDAQIILYTSKKFEDLMIDKEIAYLIGLVDILVDQCTDIPMEEDDLLVLDKPQIPKPIERAINIAEFISYINHYYKRPNELPLVSEVNYYVR